ncbi:hypothetical protein [Amycolatopsis nigrescens]|uniref:hypothetical protein n=1 Tax=Amycolatopsis nigrescens TaxID=381445 RepID=UPI00036FE736|nr:hypothetical protein [Amycolatopsis nigrescens]
MNEKKARDRRGIPFSAALSAAVLALGAAGWFGYSWWDAGQDDGIQRGIAREGVLQAAQQGVLTFNTLDFHQAAAGYDRWLEASTGTLRDELAKDTANGVKRIEEAKTVSTAKILDAAVTELDDGASTAKVIASVETVVTPDGGTPVTKHSRLLAGLTRTGDAWKLDALSPVPVTGA